jgi:hypothetical protein
MALRHKTSTPEEIAAEVVVNFSDDNKNARLIIIGTELPEGYTMRLGLKHPEAIAGIIYHHAIVMGGLQEAIQMTEALVRIGNTARVMIEKEVLKRQQNN